MSVESNIIDKYDDTTIQLYSIRSRVHMASSILSVRTVTEEYGIRQTRRHRGERDGRGRWGGRTNRPSSLRFLCGLQRRRRAGESDCRAA